MILKLLMAAVRKGASGALDRVPSAGTRNKPRGAPIRSIHPNSSPVYKTQSETALSAGLSKLSINDNKGKPGLKRNFSSGKNGLNGVKTVADVASLLQNESVKNVVVVAGAGISTPSGIPDFRSPGTGLYDNLQQYNIPYPEAIFDIDYFFLNPRPFFTLAKELYPSGKYRPNYIHYFIRQLYDKGLLLRMYTQNIDGLERLAGLPAEKLVEAHGTFASATCTQCRQKFEGSEIKEKIFSDKLPRCPTRGCVGIVKPDIVFFGEDLPRKFYSYMKDMLQTDLVLVMGTSLEVQPFAGIIDTVHANVPRVLFNREAVGPFRYSRRTQDLVSKGDLVDNMVKFAAMAGWKEDMVQLITKEEGQFTILNKPPPAAPTRNKDNNRLLYRGRAKFTLYDEDSSSEESTESDSSSSDSSDDGGRKTRYRPTNGRKTVNSTVKNGFGAKNNNQVRATSAKVNNTTKRELHTQGPRNTINGKFSPAGGLSGRSLKSESAINGNTELTRKKIQNGNKITPKETPIRKKEAFVSQSKNEVATVEKKDSDVALTLDLKDPVPVLIRNEMPLRQEDIISARSKVENPVPTPENDNVMKPKTSSEDEISTGPKEAFLSPTQLENTEQKPTPIINDKSKPVDIAENITDKQNEEHQINKPAEKTTESEKQKVSSMEREKVLKKYGIGSNMMLNNMNKVPRQTEKPQRPMKTVKSDSAIACGYFIDDLKQTSEFENNGPSDIDQQLDLAKTINDNAEALEDIGIGANGTNYVADDSENLDERFDTVGVNGKIVNEDSNVEIINGKTNAANGSEQETNAVKLQEYNVWKEEISSRDKFLNLFDKNDGSVIDGYASSTTSSKTQNRNDKGSKILNEKTARSFAKYANLTSNTNSNKRHSKKPRKISLKDRPSPGPQVPTSRTELKVVNSRPYGYAQRQANRVKGVGPFRRTNVRTLNSAIDRTTSDYLIRSGSAEIPKITYRHKLQQQTPVQDTRMFGMMAVTPALASDSSDDMIS